MSKKWVINASPLIFLAKIDQISLLPQLAKDLTIPLSVNRETLQGPPEDPAVQWVQGTGKSFVKPGPAISATILSWDLGLGESEVIAWACHNPGFEAIIDDQAARKCVLSLGIPCKGTLGIILLAKREGKIPAVKPVVDQLTHLGFRIQSELLDQFVLLAGE